MRQPYRIEGEARISENCTNIFSTRNGVPFSGFSDMKVDRSSGCQACKSCINMLFIQQQQIHIISQMVSVRFTLCENNIRPSGAYDNLLVLLSREFRQAICPILVYTSS